MKSISKLVILMLATGLVAASTGCSSSPAAKQDPGALQGIEWHLEESSEAAVTAEGVNIVAVFDGSTLSGFSGVNRYHGPYSAKEDGSFEGGPFAATLMAGPEPLMQAETAYLGMLEDVTSFKIDEDTRLTLTTKDGKTLTFAAAPASDLAGSSWTVTGYNTGTEAVVSVAEGTELTLEFGEDGTVSGNGGVNTFSGSYEYDKDGTISIGPLTQTLMAGDEALMEQEGRYLAALEASEEWEVFNGLLTLRDADGAMQVNAIVR